MRTQRTRRPKVEALEGKTLLSAAPISAAGPASALVVSHRLSLQGTIKGTITKDITHPDVGGDYDLNGNGTVLPLGNVHLGPASQLHGVGFIRGRSEGTLTLVDKVGSVTLKLVGPLQAGPTQLPTHYTYTIVSGSGTHRGATGTGSAGLAVGAFHGASFRSQSASFTLTLHATSTRPVKG